MSPAILKHHILITLLQTPHHGFVYTISQHLQQGFSPSAIGAWPGFGLNRLQQLSQGQARHYNALGHDNSPQILLESALDSGVKQLRPAEALIEDSCFRRNDGVIVQTGGVVVMSALSRHLVENI
jgi:hypothetical protein